MNVQALIQQAVQQALAAQASTNGQPSANGHTASPAQGSDQVTGLCSIHQASMKHHTNEHGSWYSHWLPSEQRNCKGRR